MSTKVRKTLTLDAEAVEAFAGDDPENLSGAVNALLVAEVERRRRRASLDELIADLSAIHGEPDAKDVEMFEALLG